MNYYRLQFNTTGIVGSISANTILGLFCRAYADKNGEDELQVLLELLKEDCETIVFSNPLYTNTFELYKSEYTYTSHNQVDRTSNIGSEPYIIPEKMLDTFDILMASTLNLHYFDELVEYMKVYGLGARKSVGKGRITDIKLREIKLDKPSKTFRCLSDFMPDDKTPVNGNIKTTVRHGVTVDGRRQNSYILLKTGSEFVNNTNITDNVLGNMILDEKTGTLIQGKTIIV